MADQDNKPAAARDEAWLELLQLHRQAVQQNDLDISDLFELRLHEYREKLVAGAHRESPLTPEAILGYAGMHGLISPRRQQWPASQVFNEKLIGLVRSALAAAARAGTDASLLAPVPAAESECVDGCEDCKWSARAGGGKCEGCAATDEPKPMTPPATAEAADSQSAPPTKAIPVTSAMRGWLEYLAQGYEMSRSPKFHTGPYSTPHRNGLTWVMAGRLEDANLIVWEPGPSLLGSPRVHARLTDAGRAVVEQKEGRRKKS